MDVTPTHTFFIMPDQEHGCLSAAVTMWGQGVSIWDAITSHLQMGEGQAMVIFLEQILEMVIGQVRVSTIPTTDIVQDRACPTMAIVQDKPLHSGHSRDKIHSGHSRGWAIPKDLSRDQLPDRDVGFSAINHTLFLDS